MGSNVPWTPEGLAYYLATNPHILQQLSQMAGSAMDSQLPLQDLLGQLYPQPQAIQPLQSIASPTEQAIQAQGAAEPVAQANPLANWQTGRQNLQQQGETALRQLQATPTLTAEWEQAYGRTQSVLDAMDRWRKTLPGHPQR